jgi:hypothetical protein
MVDQAHVIEAARCQISPAGIARLQKLGVVVVDDLARKFRAGSVDG